MKRMLLILAFLWSNFLISQTGVLVPPESVTTAFAKQYPKKEAYWSMEYGSTGSDVYFEAKFNASAKVKGYALYDQHGNFKSYKEQVLSNTLPKIAVDYLNTNYPVKVVANSKTKGKSKSKAKPLPVQSAAPAREVFSVIDAQKQKRYEVKVQKEGKTYYVIFDSIGEFIKRTLIQ